MRTTINEIKNTTDKLFCDFKITAWRLIGISFPFCWAIRKTCSEKALDAPNSFWRICWMSLQNGKSKGLRPCKGFTSNWFWTKENYFLNLFVTSKFSLCSVVWMFHSRGLNNQINFIYERTLRLIYQDCISSFTQLLLKDGCKNWLQKCLK